MDELKARRDNIAITIMNIKRAKTRTDLQKMLKNIDNTFSDISRELVECRRIHKETAHYQKLIENITNSIETVEQLLVFAALMN